MCLALSQNQNHSPHVYGSDPARLSLHEKLLSTLLLNLPPYSVGLLHHGVVVGLGVGTTDDARTAMGAATTVQC